MHTLRSPAHGWHPALAAVLERLAAIGARRREQDYEAMLARRAGARRTAHGQLEGDPQLALDTLRRIEADELQDLFNLDPPRTSRAG